MDIVFVALLTDGAARGAANFANAFTQLLATVACFWTARRAHGAERRWRTLFGLVASGSLVASLASAPTLLSGGSGAVNPSMGYAMLVLLYGLALAGLLSLPTDRLEGVDPGRSERWSDTRRWYAMTVLDCMMIVGAIILAQWTLVLAVLVRADVSSKAGRLVFLFSLALEAVSLILTATVVLIGTFRRPRSQAVLALLGAGLLIYGLTSNLVVLRAAGGRVDLPPWYLVGFEVSFLLIFLAVLAPASARPPPPRRVPPGPRAIWAHTALPYVVLGAAGLLVLGKMATGGKLDRVETYGVIALLLVALVRQMITLAENTGLLTALREREQRLEYEAFHDPLTGLANRALFTLRLHQALAFAAGPDGERRDLPAERLTVSLLFLDLDKFKQVNDASGHAVGDELLRIIAERLRAGTRATDTVARLGGDEFAVIFAGDTGPDDGHRISERLTEAVQAPCQLAGRPYTPQASLGLVTMDVTAGPATPDTLLHQADLAMYVAKRERSGRLVVYHPDLPVLGASPGAAGPGHGDGQQRSDLDAPSPAREPQGRTPRRHPGSINQYAG